MKIGIVGFGHLGKAFTKGLISQIKIRPSDIFITAKSAQTLKEAAKEYAVSICNTNDELMETVDVAFLALSKSAFIKEMQNTNSTYSKRIVSFMAGVPIEFIQNSFHHAIISRAMPNIAIADGNGIIGYTTSDESIVTIFKNLGYCFQVEERDIEKVTALSACGLGFAAYILAAFQEAGKNLGFDPSISKNLSANIFANVIKSEDYVRLISEVATKGGATEQGISHFNRMNLKLIIEDGINMAYKKVNE